MCELLDEFCCKSISWKPFWITASVTEKRKNVQLSHVPVFPVCKLHWSVFQWMNRLSNYLRISGQVFSYWQSYWPEIFVSFVKMEGKKNSKASSIASKWSMDWKFSENFACYCYNNWIGSTKAWQKDSGLSILTGFLWGRSSTLDSVDEMQPMMFKLDVILYCCSMKNPVYYHELLIRLEAKDIFQWRRDNWEGFVPIVPVLLHTKRLCRLTAEGNFRKGNDKALSFVRLAVPEETEWTSNEKSA